MKSGNLNFLEPSGPLQACNGTALPLLLLLLLLLLLFHVPCFLYGYETLRKEHEGTTVHCVPEQDAEEHMWA